jgi:tripartite-type tricarboxylate transporter receptor subunit TctC
MVSRITALLACLFALLSNTTSSAQTFPTPGRPITIVVGYAPGGGHDVMARALAQELAKELAISVIVENRPGAGGAVSVQSVARAEPDGHTLLFNSLSELAVRQAATKVSYDLDRDLVPISLVGVTPIALVVHESVPAKTLAEFRDYVNSKPDGVIYGSPGAGTLMHLAVHTVEARAAIDLHLLSRTCRAKFTM